MNVNELLDSYFFDNPTYAVLDVDKLIVILRNYPEFESIKRYDLEKYLEKRNNIYGYKKKPKFFFKIASMSYTWQVDIMFVGHDRYFAAIEINSRYGYIKSIPNRSEQYLLTCMKELIDLYKPVYRIMSDDEFNKEIYQTLCLENGIKLYTVVAKEMHKYPGNKLAYIDRFIRTIKWYFIKLNKKQVVDRKNNLKKIVDVYNNSPHDSLRLYESNKMNLKNVSLSPLNVIDDKELLIEIYTDVLSMNNKLNKKFLSKFKVGNYVRYLLPLKEVINPKRQSVRFSKEVYIINEKMDFGYRLMNIQDGTFLDRQFKPWELRKVVEPELIANVDENDILIDDNNDNDNDNDVLMDDINVDDDDGEIVDDSVRTYVSELFAKIKSKDVQEIYIYKNGEFLRHRIHEILVGGEEDNRNNLILKVKVSLSDARNALNSTYITLKSSFYNVNSKNGWKDMI